MGRFMRRRATPMAPEETRMTRWPSFMRETVVSTMTERMERRGSWVVSETMLLVPVVYGVSEGYLVDLVVWIWV